MKRQNILLFFLFVFLFVLVDTLITYIGINEPFNYEELNPILLLSKTNFTFMILWKIGLSIIILGIVLNFSDKNQTIQLTLAIGLIVILLSMNFIGIAIKIPQILQSAR